MITEQQLTYFTHNFPYTSSEIRYVYSSLPERLRTSSMMNEILEAAQLARRSVFEIVEAYLQKGKFL